MLEVINLTALIDSSDDETVAWWSIIFTVLDVVSNLDVLKQIYVYANMIINQYVFFCYFFYWRYLKQIYVYANMTLCFYDMGIFTRILSISSRAIMDLPPWKIKYLSIYEAEMLLIYHNALMVTDFARHLVMMCNDNAATLYLTPISCHCQLTTSAGHSPRHNAGWVWHITSASSWSPRISVTWIWY